MNTLSVRCQHCGAPLQIGDDLRFITCTYCKASLEIVRDDSTVHTRVLDEIHENTTVTREKLEVLDLQNEIERLDREWEMAREGFVVHGKNGSRSMPSSGGAVTGMIVGCMVGGLMLAMMSSSPIPSSAGSFFLLVPMIMIVLSLIVGFSGLAKAERYKAAEAEHLAQRQILLNRLEETRRKHS